MRRCVRPPTAIVAKPVPRPRERHRSARVLIRSKVPGPAQTEIPGVEPMLAPPPVAVRKRVRSPTMLRGCLRSRPLNRMISSIRLRNSDRKCRRSTSMTSSRAASTSPAAARIRSAAMLLVMMTTDSSLDRSTRCTLRPRPAKGSPPKNLFMMSSLPPRPPMPNGSMLTVAGSFASGAAGSRAALALPGAAQQPLSTSSFDVAAFPVRCRLAHRAHPRAHVPAALPHSPPGGVFHDDPSARRPT